MKLLFLLVFSFKIGYGFVDEQLSKEMKQCLALILNHAYAQGETLYNSIIQRYPKNIAGYGMGYLLLQYQMLDYFDTTGMKKSEKIFKKIDDITAEKLKKNPKDIEAIYYRAAIYGARSYMMIKFNNLFRGFKDGLISVRYYKKLLNYENHSCDALGALGTYYYWKGEYLDFLPFFEEDKIMGIEMLEKANTCSSYLSIPIIYSYLWVQFQEKKYEDAIKISDSILAIFPANRSFYRSKADCLFELKRWTEAEKIYDSLFLILKDPHFSNVQKIEVLSKLAYICNQNGKLEKSGKCIKNIFEISVTEWESRFVKKYLAWAQEIQEELNQKNSEKINKK